MRASRSSTAQLRAQKQLRATNRTHSDRATRRNHSSRRNTSSTNAVSASVLAGAPAALSLIFLSEVGDKTFFIAALLAAKRGRFAVLVGSMGALTLMTAISVAIGAIVNKLPAALSAYRPLTEQLAAVMLGVFGAKSLREGLLSSASADDGELSEAERVVDDSASPASATATTPANARSGADVARNAADGPRLASIAEAFSLTFAAEWGDRSMLATVALGAARSPFGVFVGATAGHAIATLLAVLSGHLLSKRVSSRAMSLTSGTLFLALGIGTSLHLI